MVEQCNRRLCAYVIAAQILQLIVMPLAPWVLLPLALLTPLWWGLIHEAMHGLLLPGKNDNERMGRSLSILFGASFHVLRYAHLQHHALNRAWESEYYRRGETTWIARAPGYYANLLGGLYLTEVAASLIYAFLPHTLGRAIICRKAGGDAARREAAERYFFKPERRRAIRRDTTAVLALYSTAFWAYGADWPLVLAALGLRGLIVSLLDNIYHYGTPADNSIPAKEIALPQWASRALLHMNHHATHHAEARQPWMLLPQRFAARARPYDEPFLRALLRQFAGPRPA